MRDASSPLLLRGHIRRHACLRSSSQNRRGRLLQLFSFHLRQRGQDRLFGHMAVRIGFDVVDAPNRNSEWSHRGRTVVRYSFSSACSFIDTLGRPADADDQHARSEGIERPGMSHFNFAVPQPTQQYAHLAHDIPTKSTRGKLVHRKHVSFREGKIKGTSKVVSQQSFGLTVIILRGAEAPKLCPELRLRCTGSKRCRQSGNTQRNRSTCPSSRY